MRSKLILNNIFYDILSLFLFWIFIILLINPIGNFPLNDDWSFSLAVNTFLTYGKFSPTGWTSMTLFSHVLWGALFGEFFGYSFSILRISTLVLSFLGISIIYYIARKLTPIRWVAYFVTLLIAFNPLFFSLSFTFMTDISFAVFSIISILFYIKSLQNTSINIPFFILGTCFAIVSILDRQIGLFIPLAFTISNIVKYGWRKDILIQSFLSISISLSTLLFFNYWLKISGNTPALYSFQIYQLLHVLTNPIIGLKNIIYYGFIIINYIGLFLSPLLIIWFHSNKKKQPLINKKFLVSSILILLTTISFYILFKKTMPYLGNIFTYSGIGPFTLYDTYILHQPIDSSAFILTICIRIIISILSVVGASLLIIFLSSKLLLWKSYFSILRKDINQNISFFLLIGTLIYLGPILLIGGFDRYLIIPIILVGLSLTIEITKIKLIKVPISSIGIILFFIIFSIISTHDYLSWNKTRWIAINELLKKGVTPSEIDGGFEFNGLFLYDSSYQRVPDKSWWWVHDNKYIVCFSKVNKYKIIYKYKFIRWMPLLDNNIYILKRNESLPEFK